MAPKQKPATSKQNYSTPKDFLEKVKVLLAIDSFGIDLAADSTNTVADQFYDEEVDSLKQDWKVDGWSWLNPPYKNLAKWTNKAWLESLAGAKVAMLVPASTGANWWKQYVHENCLCLFLNGRLSFLENGDPYPKDLALLLYEYVPPVQRTGYKIWDWRKGNIT